MKCQDGRTNKSYLLGVKRMNDQRLKKIGRSVRFKFYDRDYDSRVMNESIVVIYDRHVLTRLITAN